MHNVWVYVTIKGQVTFILGYSSTLNGTVWTDRWLTTCKDLIGLSHSPTLTRDGTCNETGSRQSWEPRYCAEILRRNTIVIHGVLIDYATNFLRYPTRARFSHGLRLDVLLLLLSFLVLALTFLNALDSRDSHRICGRDHRGWQLLRFIGVFIDVGIVSVCWTCHYLHDCSSGRCGIRLANRLRFLGLRLHFIIRIPLVH